MKAIKVFLLIIFAGLLTYFIFSYQHMEVKQILIWGITEIILLQMYTVEKIDEILKKK